MELRVKENARALYAKAAKWSTLHVFKNNIAVFTPRIKL